MEPGVLKDLDNQGRLAIPADMRRDWTTNRVMVTREGKSIVITPLEPIPPSALFDSIIVDDDVDFTDSHSVEKSVMERTTNEIYRR